MNIIWDLDTKKYWKWCNQFKIDEFPSFEFLTSDLRVGHGDSKGSSKKLHHLLLIDDDFYIANWTCGQDGDESWDFYKIENISKLLNDEYSYWELIGESIEKSNYLYKITFSNRRYNSEDLEQKILSHIPKNIKYQLKIFLEIDYHMLDISFQEKKKRIK